MYQLRLIILYIAIYIVYYASVQSAQIKITKLCLSFITQIRTTVLNCEW